MMYPYTPPPFEPLAEAIRRAGGKKPFVTSLGISDQALRKWQGVPARQAVRIEALWGVPRWKLRPDVFAADAPLDATMVVRATLPGDR